MAVPSAHQWYWAEAPSVSPRVSCVAPEIRVAEPPVSGEYSLIYLVYNGLYELPTQHDQLRCLTAAAGLLSPEGQLVLETTMPNQVFAEQQAVWVPPMDELDEVELQAMAYDPVAQTVQYRHISLASNSIRVLSL